MVTKIKSHSQYNLEKYRTAQRTKYFYNVGWPEFSLSILIQLVNINPTFSEDAYTSYIAEHLKWILHFFGMYVGIVTQF